MVEVVVELRSGLTVSSVAGIWKYTYKRRSKRIREESDFLILPLTSSKDDLGSVMDPLETVMELQSEEK